MFFFHNLSRKKLGLLLIILLNLSLGQIIAEEDTLKLKLNKLLIDQEEALSAEKAFRILVEIDEANRLIINWKIAKECFLYKDKFNLKFDPDFNYSSEIKNKPIKIDDLYFGNVDVFYNEVEMLIPLDNNLQKNLVLVYQGCNEKGYCYPPIEKKIKIAVNREISLL
jgi:thiol:disulfide interchange protein|tara:strand:+ start:392 stop:892 length:501 start_codon:yes stop_codon:yes gene_type:complete